MTELKHISQLKEIKILSETKKIAVFKHSTRCGISKIVLRRFKNEIIPVMNDTEIYILDLIRYRELSNRISEIYKIRHQSPQLILIKKGKPFFDASHYDILNYKD